MATDVGRSLTDLKDTVRRYWRVAPGTGARVGILARHPVRALTTLADSRGVRRGRTPAVHYRLLGMTEQEPNRESRVVLGSRRDRYGQPVARLEWRLTDRDLATFWRTQEVLSDALERAGIGRIMQRFGDTHPPLGSGAHERIRTGRHTRTGTPPGP